MAKYLTAIMLPPEEEEFPTKGMTPIHKKWMTSKGRLSGREKKRVSRFTGDRQYHLMEQGRRAERKAKETLRSALNDTENNTFRYHMEQEALRMEQEAQILEEKRKETRSTIRSLEWEVEYYERQMRRAEIALEMAKDALDHLS